MIYIGLKDLDKGFSSAKDPTIITEIPLLGDGDAIISRSILMMYESDTVDNTPSCFCGEKRAEWKVDSKIPCQKCGTMVGRSWGMSATGSDYGDIWFRKPAHIHKLINLKTLLNMMYFFQTRQSGFCPISFFINRAYPAPKKKSLKEDLLGLGFKRGYNSFVENYIEIVNGLLGLTAYKEKAKNFSGVKDLKSFLAKNKERSLCDHHPLPKKNMIIIEKTPLGTYKDPSGVQALDGIRMLQGLDYETEAVQERRLSKATVILAHAHILYLTRNIFYRKYGLARKNIFGSRSHFSFRCVISSTSCSHDMTSCVVPWKSAVASLQPHLMNKLVKKGFGVMDAKRLIYESVSSYNSTISDCLNEIVSETETGTLTITLQRNPTQGAESIHLLDAYINRDVSDLTIHLPVLLTKFYTADYDGDEQNAMIMLDRKMRRLMDKLRSHYNLIDLRKPWAVSNRIHLPDTVIATSSKWLENGLKEESASTRRFMDSLSPG